MSGLYDTDVFAWSERQAGLLRRRAAGELVNEADIDWLDVAEEIEDVGKSQQREIESRLAVLCARLLKWQFQPERRSAGWAGSIAEARTGIARVIRKSPSLKSYPAQALAEAYDDGRQVAEAETGLTLPAERAWAIEQVLDRDFWPPG